MTGTAWPFALEDPYPAYAALRAAGAVHWVPELDAYVAVSFDVAEHVLRSPVWSSEPGRGTAFADRFGPSGASSGLMARSILFEDGPAHARLRRALGSWFTPRACEKLRARVVSIVGSACDHLDPGAAVDLMSAVATAVPLAVMCELLDTGVDVASTLQIETPRLIGLLDPTADEATRDAGISAAVALMLELVPLVAERRADPGPDLLSHLCHHSDGLEPDEAVLMAITLLTAGHETTANLVGNGLATMALLADRASALTSAPEAMGPFLEELLRYESPVQLTMRTARATETIGDVEVPQGRSVFVCIGAANRDPAAFVDPDRFDMARPGRPHLAFGHGVHFCAGASLARLEASIILGTLLERIPHLIERIGPPRRGTTPTFRRVETLTLEP